MIKISEAFDRSWNDIKDNLSIVAGLTFVLFIAIGAVSLIPIAGSFLSEPFMASYKHCLNKIRHKQEIDYNDFFWAFTDLNRFLQVIVLMLASGLMTAVLTILLFFPGVWFIVAASMATSLFVLNGGKDGIGSIKRSVTLAKGHWWSLFLLMNFCLLLSFAGLLCFAVGILVTTPILSLMYIHIVESLEKTQPLQPETQNAGASTFQMHP